MAKVHVAVNSPRRVETESLSILIGELQTRGYEVVGPTVCDGAIVFRPINSVQDLPAGWTADEEPGRYRLRRREDGALFGYGPGPESLKRFVHPADTRLFAATRDNGSFRMLSSAPEFPNRAILGVRSCDLAGLAILDRVLLHDRFVDRIYEASRKHLFLVAVNCTEPRAQCFCSSVGPGPEVAGGYDLLLTEMLANGDHWFLAEAGSDAGREILATLPGREPTTAEMEQARSQVREAAAKMLKRFDPAVVRERLYARLEHPGWQDCAERCLNCGNCTMSCPTCFCVSVSDTSDMTLATAERQRRWESCFNLSFSYIHGGVVRESSRARFRHRVLHKLATWHDQFGEPGCTGCGRCITWCPAGIDFVEEVAAVTAAT